MKKILGLILVLFLAQNLAFSYEAKFMVVSDTHISSTKEYINENGLTTSIHKLQKAIKQINKSDVDFVVFSGDAVDKASKIDTVMFAKIINKLKKPYYVLLGNNDLSYMKDINAKEFYRLVNKFSHNRVHRVPTVKKRNGLVFILMDGTHKTVPAPNGFYKDEELIWLDKKLKKYENKDVVILQHFPIIPPYESSSAMVYKPEEYLNVLAKHKNVVAIISGHYHVEDEIMKDNVLHISVPSLAVSGEYKEITIEKKLMEDVVVKSKVFSVE